MNIDKKGRIAIEPVYSDADYFKEGIAFVNIGGYQGAINTRGVEVIPVEYDSIYRSEGYIIAEINDEREYYSLNGERISDTEYVNRINIESEDIGTEKLVEELNEKYDYVGIFHNDIAEVYWHILWDC